MVERRITSSEEIKEKYLKVGVVVFILNKKGEVLVIRENSNSETTAKNVGEFGVLCETAQEGENWRQTLIRGLQEELDMTNDEIESCFVFNPDYCFLGESIFVEGVLARVAVVGCRDDVFLEKQVKDDAEVSVIGWRCPEELISYSLRIGVRKILQECLGEGLLSNPEDIFNNDTQSLSVLFL